MSILIIDDCQEERHLLFTILHSAGFGPLLSVGTAREGLQLLGGRETWKADQRNRLGANISIQAELAEMQQQYGMIAGKMTVEVKGQEYTL